ncbi:MAG: DUF4190 domain-containing protein [Anaerolineales bacterium]|jgi:hypothetical protein
MTEQLPPTPAPVYAPTPTSDKKGFAIASLVLGILSLCGSAVFWCGGLISIIGIVLGALGVNSKSKSIAIAGIILSALGLILAIIFRVVFRGILFNHYWQQFLTNRGF